MRGVPPGWVGLPLAFVSALVTNTACSLEHDTAAALRLASPALVQVVTACGVAVLAFANARGHPSRLARARAGRRHAGLAGLVLLALSLAGATESDGHPAVVGAVTWTAACAGGAALLIVMRTPAARAASLGLAVGRLFADGDISAKLVEYCGLWLVALAPLILA